MPADVFVDTNILLYAISNRPEERNKTDVARKILRTERWCWSTQVAGEFFANAVSSKRPFRISAKEAASFVETWLAFPMVSLTPDIVLDAMSIHQRFQLSYWDAVIVAAAKAISCHVVYSEDLSAGESYGRVQVVNPFALRNKN
ncbi:MAG: PIN domain-containing protein [Burkholderiales bacterium]